MLFTIEKPLAVVDTELSFLGVRSLVTVLRLPQVNSSNERTT
jgi:hypothetical protein